MKRPFNVQMPQAVARAGKDSDFRVFCKGAEGDSPAEMLIYDTIGEDIWGEGVTAMQVKDFLAGNQGKAVDVKVNSFGGDAYEGFVIHNALANHDGEVVVTIDGIAFSAASYIALAGDRLRMNKASDIGIHEASTIAWGNKREMTSVQKWLAKIDDHLVDIYADKTGRERAEIEGWLAGDSDGTVFSASEALELGFADEVIEPAKSKKSASKTKQGQSSSAKATRARSAMAARNKLALQRLRK